MMKPRFRVHVAVLVLLTLATAFAGAWMPRALAAEAPCQANCVTIPRPEDEVWLISSRSSGCTSAFSYHLYQSGAWRWSDAPTFQGLSAKTTVIYTHGLAVQPAEAQNEGWQVYRTLAASASPAVPIRFVTYSWPSQIGRRPLRGARGSHRQADFEGQRLAGLLTQTSAQGPVSLIGHSSGAKVIAATLESLADRPVQTVVPVSTSAATASTKRPTRAIFLAGAVDNNSLLPGCSYGRAVSQVEELLNLFDPCDHVLRWYRFLERGHSGPEAVGYTGLASRYLSAADNARLRQINSSPYIGREHSLGTYLASPPLMAEVRAAALFER